MCITTETVVTSKGRIHLSDMEIETIKKEKLLLKDEALKTILEYRKSKA